MSRRFVGDESSMWELIAVLNEATLDLPPSGSCWQCRMVVEMLRTSSQAVIGARLKNYLQCYCSYLQSTRVLGSLEHNVVQVHVLNSPPTTVSSMAETLKYW
jgi:hypothetical protein